MNIRPRERDSILQALRSGVVPRVGQQHIQVGRKAEVQAMLADLERVASGGASFRVIVGEYGAGKTYFLQLVKDLAAQMKLAVATADLNPDRRLQGSRGQARSLYAELMRNLATRSRPEGNALNSVVERFVEQAKTDATQEGVTADVILDRRLTDLKEMVNGFDFASVVRTYYQASEAGNIDQRDAALRWIRGEFTTKTDAWNALGVRTYVDDESVYDQLKLMGRFVRMCGYSGLVVCLDEMVNLYKITNTVSRQANYEQILRILNDTLQGHVEGLGIIMGGTPEFLTDPRRGLYSYEALRTRLSENDFARQAGLTDVSGPVVRLKALSNEEFFLLLQKLRNVHAAGRPGGPVLSDEAIPAFMQHAAHRLGDAYFRTPRTTITAFLNLLALLEQNPGLNWKEVLGGLSIEPDHGAAADADADEEALASFSL